MSDLARRAESLVKECRFQYRTKPSLPVLELCDVAEALAERVLALEGAIRKDLAEHDDALAVGGSGDFYETRRLIAAEEEK